MGIVGSGEFETRFPQKSSLFSVGEPYQVRVIHVFFYCDGSPGLLIHPYSWHNRSKSGSSVTVPRAESGGRKVQNSCKSWFSIRRTTRASEFGTRRFAGPPMGALKSDQL